MDHTPVSPTEFAALTGVDDWRVVLRTIRADFDTGSFGAGADLVPAIAAAADRADHHPDIDLRYPGRLRVTLTTHATGGLTTADVDLARTISDLAARAGARSAPLASQAVEVAIDTLDPALVRPFWRAVLAYGDGGDGALVDPAGAGPPVWFQQMDEPRPQRNRIHLDVVVAHDEADARIEAAVAAGGTVIDDRRARAFWVLADPEGNEACICTWEDRG
jgi:4a-hydroxytetrahydrobiopterin dehydratase